MENRKYQLLIAAAALLHSSSGFVTSQVHLSHHIPATIHVTDRSKARIPSTLDAVSVMTEPDQSLSIMPIVTSARTAWPKRLVKKVLGRDRKLLSTSVLEETPETTMASHPPIPLTIEHDSRSLSSSSSQTTLPVNDLLAAHEQLLSENGKALSPTNILSDEPMRSSPPLARYAETTLATLIHRWSEGSHENLQVHCDANGGMSDLVKGRFRADATVAFDRLGFEALRMSQGKLTSQRLALNVVKFAPFCQRIPRFPSAFDLEAHDVTFTSKDLFESTCVRHGLRRLLVRILRNRGMGATQVDITSIQILPSGKVSIKGSATPHALFDAAKVEFEVRSFLGTGSRGHVLTFPGLELSLSPAMGLFVPVVPTISLDLGHNFQIKHVELNGQSGTLQLSCRTTITPSHTRKLKHYEQKSNAYAAAFHFDVGRWLTRIGNFSN